MYHIYIYIRIMVIYFKFLNSNPGIATQQGHRTVVRLLLEAGASASRLLLRNSDSGDRFRLGFRV